MVTDVFPWFVARLPSVRSTSTPQGGAVDEFFSSLNVATTTEEEEEEEPFNSFFTRRVQPEGVSLLRSVTFSAILYTEFAAAAKQSSAVGIVSSLLLDMHGARVATTLSFQPPPVNFFLILVVSGHSSKPL
jgi:hypothetical protein